MFSESRLPWRAGDNPASSISWMVQGVACRLHNPNLISIFTWTFCPFVSLPHLSWGQLRLDLGPLGNSGWSHLWHHICIHLFAKVGHIHRLQGSWHGHTFQGHRWIHNSTTLPKSRDRFSLPSHFPSGLSCPPGSHPGSPSPQRCFTPMELMRLNNGHEKNDSFVRLIYKKIPNQFSHIH